MKYGGLIIGTPPFNVLAILLIPYYLCVKDEEKLIAVNNFFTKLVFLPIALIMSVVFAALSLAMVPFAYLQAINIKFRNLCCKQSKERDQDEKPKEKGKKKRT